MTKEKQQYFKYLQFIKKKITTSDQGSSHWDWEMPFEEERIIIGTLHLK